MITKSRVLELFNYVDGVLVYKSDGLRRRAGQKAGWKTDNGYLRVDIDGKKYYVHRVVWVYHNGDCGDYLIDHIDGDKTNNQISNLRLSNKSLNGFNRRKARSDSESSLIGVLSGKTKKGTKTFQARITINGVRIGLGNYKSAEEAHLVYLDAKKKLINF
jgi:hypothetical protein